MTRREIFGMAFAALKKGQLSEAEKLLSAATEQEQPKAAVLYVEEAKLRYLRAFGAAKEDSKFLIASITKPMTAAAVMWLVGKQRLRLNDPVSKYLPGFALGPRGAMVVRQLLTHNSGLPDMLPENVSLRRRKAGLDEYVRLSIETPLLFAPGEKWSYSSTGILLAAEIARRIDGRPISQLLNDEIFRPLGMNDSVLGLGNLRLDQVVRSQTEFAPGDLGGGEGTVEWDWNSAYWRGLGAPWGGAHSTASDIAKFLRVFLNGKDSVLSKATLASMVQNQNPAGLRPYGLGWALGPALTQGLGPRAFGHGGSTGTLCWADPDRGRIFVLLTSLPDVVARKKVIEPVSGSVARA